MLQFHHFYAECIIFILNFVIFMQSSIIFMLKYYILCFVTTYKGTLFMHTYIRYLYIECAFNMSSNKSNTAGFVESSWWLFSYVYFAVSILLYVPWDGCEKSSIHIQILTHAFFHWKLYLPGTEVQKSISCLVTS